MKYIFLFEEKSKFFILKIEFKGDAGIVKFLAEEIASEKQNQKPLTKLEGWEVNTNKGKLP